MGVRAGTWLLALSAALAGCSSEEPPGALPPLQSQSPAPLAASGTAVPAEATAETPQAASAFARHFLTAVDTAFKSADPRPIRVLSDPGCGGCESLATAVAELADQRQRQVGGDYVDVRAATPAFAGGDVLVDITYRRIAGEIVDEQGQVITAEPPIAQTAAQLRLVRRASGWIVQGYRIVDA